jgi:hypothetical protein
LKKEFDNKTKCKINMTTNEEQERTADAVLKTSLDYTQEMFDVWIKMYQSTIGKFSQFPTIGPAREKEEKLMKSFPQFVNLYSSILEANIDFQMVLMEAARKTHEKMVKEERTFTIYEPEKFKDYYNIWIEMYSETFKDFMKSGHYANDMGKLLSNFIEFQKNNRSIIEENILKPNNIPTKTEIDELSKEIYDLKMNIKELEKKVNSIIKIQKVGPVEL